MWKSPKRLVKRARRARWERKLDSFRARHRQEPAPLRECLDLRRSAGAVLPGQNVLVPRSSQGVIRGEHLKDPELARLFADVEFGAWTLTIGATDWLVDQVAELRPRCVLEFGSGLSTACLAVVLRRLHGPGGFRLLSLDQGAAEAARTEDRLRALGVADGCRVVHCPLIPEMVAGQVTSGYDLDAVSSEHFEWLGPAEFVIVDGPFAEGLCRYGTLVHARPYLAVGTRFAMHDALREKELAIASLWATEGLQVDGVYTVDEGWLVGSVPASAPATSLEGGAVPCS